MKKEFNFTTTDKAVSLHTICWLPDDRSPRAVLQIVHGISEHMKRYDLFATYLMQHGIIVFGCDLPGHGSTASTSEEYGYFADQDGWHMVTQALYELGNSMKQSCPNLPFFLLGHSMGSFLVRTLLIDYPELAEGAILSGTGQPKERLLRFSNVITHFAAYAFGAKKRMNAIDHLVMGSNRKRFASEQKAASWISRDTAVVERYVADPLCNFVPTVSLYRDMLEGLAYIGNPLNLSSMKKETPLYFFSGGQDPVGENGVGVRRIISALEEAGFLNIQYKIYPEGRHEMLNELNRLEVYDDLLHWLNKQMGSRTI
jgi:alpha-beta hydrolase superfamily lysophospholipase